MQCRPEQHVSAQLSRPNMHPPFCSSFVSVCFALIAFEIFEERVRWDCITFTFDIIISLSRFLTLFHFNRILSIMKSKSRFNVMIELIKVAIHANRQILSPLDPLAKALPAPPRCALRLPPWVLFSDEGPVPVKLPTELDPSVPICEGTLPSLVEVWLTERSLFAAIYWR